MLKIGKVQLKNNLLLAPMAGITDQVFIKLVKKFSKNILVGTEMISIDGIIHGNETTMNMLNVVKKNHPISLQLFGNDEHKFVHAIGIVLKSFRPDIIDINLGCPVNKVCEKSKSGAWLLREPDKIGLIVKTIKTAYPDIPLTIKIRLGYDAKHINTYEVCRNAEENGVDAITIHGRTREQGFTGKIDWKLIGEVKSKISVPIIANGNITCQADIDHIASVTNCDGYMIGREAIGRPWIFRELLKKKEFKWNKKIKIMIKHLKMLVKCYGEKVGVNMYKTYIPYYLKGKENNRSVLNEINQLVDYKQIIDILKSLKNK